MTWPAPQPPGPPDLPRVPQGAPRFHGEHCRVCGRPGCILEATRVGSEVGDVLAIDGEELVCPRCRREVPAKAGVPGLLLEPMGWAGWGWT